MILKTKFAALFSASIFALSLTGCGNQESAETAGQAMDEADQKAHEIIDNASDTAHETMESAEEKMKGEEKH